MQGIPLRNVKKEGEAAVIAASEKYPMGIVNMGQMRDLVVTSRILFNASATLGARLNMYYSPDGELFDSIPFAYYNITLTAGATVQESAIIDAPSVGYIKMEMENLDSGYSITNAEVYTSFSRWGDEFLQEADKMSYRHGISAQKKR
jgi:hypothetical protein